MTYLLVGGCSWSDINYNSPDPDYNGPKEYLKWSEHLANYLDVPLVSVAWCGRGQYYNYPLLMDRILSDNPPEYVVWQLSGSRRFEIPGSSIDFCSPILNPKAGKELTTLGHRYMRVNNRDDLIDLVENAMPSAVERKHLYNVAKNLLDSIFYYSTNTYDLLEEQFRMIYRFKRTCELLGIKFFVFATDVNIIDRDGLRDNLLETVPEYHVNSAHNIARKLQMMSHHPLEKYKSKTSKQLAYGQVLRQITSTDIFKTLEGDHTGIYGWPFFPELGGETLCALRDPEYSRGELTVSAKDQHPNSLGHKILFEKVAKEWNI